MMDGDDAAYTTVVTAGGDPYQAIVNRLHLDYVSREHAAVMVEPAQPSLF